MLIRPKKRFLNKKMKISRGCTASRGTKAGAVQVKAAPDRLGSGGESGGLALSLSHAGALERAHAARAPRHLDAGRDPLLDLAHVRDDADQPPLGLEAGQGREHRVERLIVERAEALVEEERLDPRVLAEASVSDRLGKCEIRIVQ